MGSDIGGLVTALLGLWALSTGRADGAPLPGAQKTARSICMENLTGRINIDCGDSFHCEVQDGSLTPMCEQRADMNGFCVIPKSDISPPCEAVRTDDSGKREEIQVTIVPLKARISTPSVSLTAPSTSNLVSEGTTGPAHTGRNRTGIIVAVCFVLALGLALIPVLFPMFQLLHWTAHKV